jgi:hypothetical protein
MISSDIPPAALVHGSLPCFSISTAASSELEFPWDVFEKQGGSAETGATDVKDVLSR